MLKLLAEHLREEAATMTKAVVGVVAPATGVGISYVEAISAWIRLVALLTGCGVSLVMLVSLLRGMRDKLRQQRAQARLAEMRLTIESGKLCAACIGGQPPVRCPIATEERPADCPRRKEVGS